MSEAGPRVTYLDAGVLIAAFGSLGPLRPLAWSIAMDSRRPFVTSDILMLEVFPQPTRNQRTNELVELTRFFAQAQRNVGLDSELCATAYSLACRFGLRAADALHLAAAVKANCAEFVTTEKKSKAFGSVLLPGLQLTFLSARASTP